MWFTLQQKVELYKMHKEHPNWSQDDIACWFQRTYHSLKKPSQTTISRALKSGAKMIVQLEASETAVQNGETVAQKPRKKSTPTAAAPKKRKSLTSSDSKEDLKKAKISSPDTLISDTEKDSTDYLLTMSKHADSGLKDPNSKDESTAVASLNNTSHSIPKRTLQNQLLRKILREWISQTAWNNIPITFPILKGTAASIWQKLPLEKRKGNGFFTYKWLVKFLERCDIERPSSSKSCIELSKPTKIWSFEERDLLKSFLMQIPKKDLFTLDETLLAYNLPMDKTYYGVSKLKKQIEIMTVMLCVNVDASEKLAPLCIGKYANYQCFKDEFGDKSDEFTGISSDNYALYHTEILERFGIQYDSNQESFLTSTMFHNWLTAWDNELKTINRQIYIILDDCCSHRIMNVKLTNITLIYTRAEKKFLPFNWGIIDEFKTRYRQQEYEALIALQKNITRIKGSKKKEVLTFQQSKINICNAFKLITRAWNSISEASLMTSWKASGILPADYITMNKPISMGLKKSDIFLKILERLQSEFRVFSKWDPEMLLDLSIEHRSLKFVSLQELIDFATVLPWEPLFDDVIMEASNNIIPASTDGRNNGKSEDLNNKNNKSNDMYSVEKINALPPVSPLLPYSTSPIRSGVIGDSLISGDVSSLDGLDFQNEALDQEVLAILNMTNFERQLNNQNNSSNNYMKLDTGVGTNPDSVDSNSLLQFNDLHNGITNNIQKGDLTINNKPGFISNFIKQKSRKVGDGSRFDNDDVDLSDENSEEEDENITPHEVAENKQIRSGIPILNNMANSPVFADNNSFLPEFRERKDSLLQMFEYNGLDEFRQQLGGIGGYGASQPHLQHPSIDFNTQPQEEFASQQPANNDNEDSILDSNQKPDRQLQQAQTQEDLNPVTNIAASPLLAEFPMLEELQKQEQARTLLMLINEFVSFQNQPSMLKPVEIKMSIELQLELSTIYNDILSFFKSDNFKKNYFFNVNQPLSIDDAAVIILNNDPTTLKKLIDQLQDFLNYFKLPRDEQIFSINSFTKLNEFEHILNLLSQSLQEMYSEESRNLSAEFSHW